MLDVQSWSIKKPNGTSKDLILDCMAEIVKRQRGTQVTIQKIAKHIKAKMDLKAKHADLAKLMIEHGAVTVGSSQRSTHIFDITGCVLKKRRARKGRSHSRIE